LDIAKERPEIGSLLDLRTEFLYPKSSFQDDRNASETGAIFPVVPWLTLCTYGATGTEKHPVGKGGGGNFVTLDMWMKNQDGELVGLGTAHVYLP
jgi:hypothetical protein